MHEPLVKVVRKRLKVIFRRSVCIEVYGKLIGTVTSICRLGVDTCMHMCFFTHTFEIQRWNQRRKQGVQTPNPLKNHYRYPLSGTDPWVKLFLIVYRP